MKSFVDPNVRLGDCANHQTPESRHADGNLNVFHESMFATQHFSLIDCPLRASALRINTPIFGTGLSVSAALRDDARRLGADA